MTGIIIACLAIFAALAVVTIANGRKTQIKVSTLPPPPQKPKPKRESTALLTSTTALQTDIQACTDRLVNARLARDKQQEIEALLRMESLMVSAAQQLQCIIDYLKEEKK